MSNNSPGFESQDDLLLALSGSAEDANRAIIFIHREYGGKLLGTLRRKTYLTDADRDDIIQEVYARLRRKALENTLNIDMPVEALIITMAKNAAVDLVRKRDTERRLLNSDEYAVLNDEIRQSRTIAARQCAQEKADMAADLLNAFDNWLDGLPRKEMVVAQAWADCQREAMQGKRKFPKQIGPSIVCRAMLAKGLDPGSVMAVKGAMQRVFDKFRAYLKDGKILQE